MPIVSRRIFLLNTILSLVIYFTIVGCSIATISHDNHHESRYIANHQHHHIEYTNESQEHTIVIILSHKSIDSLERLLENISNEDTNIYGKHLSRESISIFSPGDEKANDVAQYFTSQGGVIIKRGLHGSYLTVKGNIALWNKIFSTSFEDMHLPTGEIIRGTRDIWIPKELENKIDSVLNILHTPLPIKIGVMTPLTRRSKKSLRSSPCTAYQIEFDGYCLPNTINTIRNKYNITTTNISSSNQSNVVIYAQDYYANNDLLTFQSIFSLKPAKVFRYGTTETGTICEIDPTVCEEASLGVQYVSGLSSPDSFISYSYNDYNDGFLYWLMQIQDLVPLPTVVVINYVYLESDLPLSIIRTFDIIAMKLSAMGVTIVVSSGDDGVHSPYGACGYQPLYPATSRFALVVGATSGPEKGAAEVVAQVDTSGDSRITSGGGFSSTRIMPAYQKDVVQRYLNSTSGRKAVRGFNPNGRAYPDISLLGVKYLSIIGGNFYSQEGTSASAPAVAALISLINNARLKKRLTTLGWLNWSLYKKSSVFMNDIVSGDNKSPRGGAECTEGFAAAAGWDPVTGLGSINFGKMMSYYLTVSNKPSGKEK